MWKVVKLFSNEGLSLLNFVFMVHLHLHLQILSVRSCSLWLLSIVTWLVRRNIPSTNRLSNWTLVRRLSHLWSPLVALRHRSLTLTLSNGHIRLSSWSWYRLAWGVDDGAIPPHLGICHSWIHWLRRTCMQSLVIGWVLIWHSVAWWDSLWWGSSLHVSRVCRLILLVMRVSHWNFLDIIIKD